MNRHYHDIMSKINEEPQWFDEHAVPRYCSFSPDAIANIYANECCLILIRCQSCHHLFNVAMSYDPDGSYLDEPRAPLTDQGTDLHYGDPPNVDCCIAGPTMSCEDTRILEYWYARQGMLDTRSRRA